MLDNTFQYFIGTFLNKITNYLKYFPEIKTIQKKHNHNSNIPYKEIYFFKFRNLITVNIPI